MMMINHKKRNAFMIKRGINVSLFPEFGSDWESGLGLQESLDFEIDEYYLKSWIEFEIMLENEIGILNICIF